jgi:adenylyltransferase/sulfurtransferase
MKEEELFSKQELDRYSRHFVLPQFGETAQAMLKSACVAVVGAGGLGCPALQYLAAAGVGKILIFDFDKICLSNLQRQVVYTTDDIGALKAEVAAARLQKLNAHIELQPHCLQLNASNALLLLRTADVILDCTDNFATRYLLNDVCVLLNKPLVYGSVFRYEGQLAVFNWNQSATYRDLYPLPPHSNVVENCEQAGVLGVLTGVIGTMQANEAIKIITGIGQPLANRLFLLDVLTLQTQTITITNKNARQTILHLIDYDDFCNPQQQHTMKEVTVQELKALKDSKADFQLIDVREPHEYDICNLEGELIPQAEIPHNVDKIANNKQVIIHCRSGARSGNMVKWLESNHGFTNLYNLKGGILAWAKEIDNSMPTY